MSQILQALTSTLADYLSDAVLDRQTLSAACILDALASLDITLVEGRRQHTDQRLRLRREKL